MKKGLARKIIFSLFGIFCFLGLLLFSDGMNSLRQAQEAAISQRNECLSDWVFSHSARISRSTANEIVEEAMKYRHGLLMLAIFEVESNYVPSALSNKGARGLGQIHWPSHKGVLIKTTICENARDLFDIKINVKATNLVLTDMLKRSNHDVIQTLKLYLGEHNGPYTLRILNNFVQLSLIAESNGK